MTIAARILINSLVSAKSGNRRLSEITSAVINSFNQYLVSLASLSAISSSKVHLQDGEHYTDKGTAS